MAIHTGTYGGTLTLLRTIARETGQWTSAHDRPRMINIQPRVCCVPDPVCTEKTHDRSCAQERGHGSPRYRNQIDKPVWRIGNAR